MACDFDELDIDLNPFYVALQSKYMDLYERAQESCYLLCVPQTQSINAQSINTDFVETHILRPSPYFKGQFMTTHSSNSKTLRLSDNGHYFTTLQGFADEMSVKILREELAYNKEYKQYKILILERPLDTKFELKDPHCEELKVKQYHTHKISVNQCTDFLKSFPQFNGVVGKLDKNIEYFCRHYMVLADYLDDAVARLEDISSDTHKELCKRLKPPLSSDLKLREVLAGVVESYLMNAVYPKVYPVICNLMSQEDKTLLSKCHKLNKVRPEQIGVRKEFCCPLPTAVVELANLGSLHTPREKLACLKSTVDNITEGISIFLKEKNPTPSLVGLVPEDEDDPCITSDDLIPILVMVIAQAKCCHLHSDLFYMERFRWESADRDRDDLGYCLVSFKAAAQYMTKTDFSHLNESSLTSDKEISIEELMAATSLRSSPSTPSRTSAPDTQKRRERQLNRISDILGRSAHEMGSQYSREETPLQLQSIFPERMMKPAPPPDLIPAQDIRNTAQNIENSGSSQLGDFLSALQDDDFDQPFGKQN